MNQYAAKDIISAVLTLANVDMDQITTPHNSDAVTAFARIWMAGVLRDLTQKSFREIGELMGHKQYPTTTQWRCRSWKAYSASLRAILTTAVTEHIEVNRANQDAEVAKTVENCPQVPRMAEMWEKW